MLSQRSHADPGVSEWTVGAQVVGAETVGSSSSNSLQGVHAKNRIPEAQERPREPPGACDAGPSGRASCEALVMQVRVEKKIASRVGLFHDMPLPTNGVAAVGHKIAVQFSTNGFARDSAQEWPVSRHAGSPASGMAAVRRLQRECNSRLESSGEGQSGCLIQRPRMVPIRGKLGGNCADSRDPQHPAALAVWTLHWVPWRGVPRQVCVVGLERDIVCWSLGIENLCAESPDVTSCSRCKARTLPRK